MKSGGKNESRRDIRNVLNVHFFICVRELFLFINKVQIFFVTEKLNHVFARHMRFSDTVNRDLLSQVALIEINFT